MKTSEPGSQSDGEVLADLLSLMRLERLEDNLFRGQSRDIGSPRVFGGQVLGQALAAAGQTVTGRAAHSLHAYFLRAGDVESPIVYEVDRSRDGRSFTSRRVVAIQHGRPILNLAASFQLEEDGLDHQAEMPRVPGPESLADSRHYKREVVSKVPEKMRRYLTTRRPFEFRHVEPPDLLAPRKRPAEQFIWFRALGELSQDPELHKVLLAYVSDYNLIGTATLPHGISFLQGNVQMASLDHAMWFHRQARLDQWLLYALDSPSASGARGLARGRIFTADGLLVASTAQEGLIRLWPGDG
ncbi:MAG: acyl-CoA thioesterase II [Gammaproteobacteria bacterium]|nr:acyl-CoA thioesterase II [Gammaproteobacteria bacterium]